MRSMEELCKDMTEEAFRSLRAETRRKDRELIRDVAQGCCATAFGQSLPLLSGNLVMRA